MKSLDRALANGSIAAIKFYQKTISPDHSWIGKLFPYKGCKFYPTCSMYAISTLEERGFLRGAPAALWRIIRCNPWSEGGVDLPKK